jgi:tetraacyldisaccharide 4'-kinase
MSLAALASAVWEEDTLAARTLRTALTPAAWLFGQVVSRRNARFDATPPRSAALPAISIGNLTVGGTGKTPVAAWCVRELRARGARPAIVLRGVGDDEWRVHGLLNPGTAVVVSPDRTAGMVVARTKGADCVVLDDAFQHRQAARVVDVVLLSADRWTGTARLLPAGPFREPLSSLRRAQLVVITVKAAHREQVEALQRAIEQAAPEVPVAVIRLTPGELRLALSVVESRSPGQRGPSQPGRMAQPTAWLRGQAVAVVSAVGDPAAFETQLRGMGADLRVPRRFPDHHRFTAAEAAVIARDAAGTAGVVCTLKDAVKLAPLWPREAPVLWYLSQSVVVDRGAEAFDRAFGRLLAVRAATAPTAG